MTNKEANSVDKKAACAKGSLTLSAGWWLRWDLGLYSLLSTAKAQGLFSQEEAPSFRSGISLFLWLWPSEEFTGEREVSQVAEIVPPLF